MCHGQSLVQRQFQLSNVLRSFIRGAMPHGPEDGSDMAHSWFEQSLGQRPSTKKGAAHASALQGFSGQSGSSLSIEHPCRCRSAQISNVGGVADELVANQCSMIIGNFGGAVKHVRTYSTSKLNRTAPMLVQLLHFSERIQSTLFLLNILYSA